MIRIAILCCPNQLFDWHHWYPLLQKNAMATFFVVDDPMFYGDRRGNPLGTPVTLKLNTLRICYQMATVKEYVLYLKHHYPGFHVQHVSFDTLHRRPSYDFLKGYDAVYAYDPMDALWIQRVAAVVPSNAMHIMSSPSFLLTKEDIDVLNAKTKDHKRLQQRTVYDYVRKKVNFLVDVPSYDADNRKPFKTHDQHKIPTAYTPRLTRKWNKAEWETLWASVRAHDAFNDKDHPCPLDMDVALEHVQKLPLTRADALKWWRQFLKQRFALFGPYEDAIVETEPYLYHSGISIFLNNGWLTPMDILKSLRTYHRTIPMQSLEGFARQVLGWREYARFYYERVLAVPQIIRRNPFRFSRRLPSNYTSWYKGTTNIPLVDSAIRDAFNYGYLHHIRRLMVLSNAMLLHEWHADFVYKWMFEFALDSWEWVMVFNVYSMATYCDHGYGMRKPYLSSSAYLLRMSDVGKGTWTAPWDSKYQSFVKKYQVILHHVGM